MPKINKLGSKEWEKTKAKINERVNEIAEMIAPNDTTGKAKEVAALMLNKK